GAGKHVLVQKPLAVSEVDALATVMVGDEAQRLVFVDYTYRFVETMQVFRKRLIDIGPPRSVRAAFHNIYGPGAEKTWFFDVALSGGGALTDLGVHLIDLALWLLEPRSLDLEARELTGEGIETAAHLRVTLDRVPFDVAVSWN